MYIEIKKYAGGREPERERKKERDMDRERKRDRDRERERERETEDRQIDRSISAGIMKMSSLLPFVLDGPLAMSSERDTLQPI